MTNYRKILEYDSSIQLVRTNPKLTGNIKLTIDSNDMMWLNSIDANTELAKIRYKKFPVNLSVDYGRNIFQFLNNGKVPNNILFEYKSNVKVESVSNNYEDQFDFNDYFSGVKYNPSRFYTDRYSYFAPLYLKTDVPDYFVIFKIPGAMNYNIETSKQQYELGFPTYFYDMLKTAEVQKIFDISDKTKVGKYIRSIINNEQFPNEPVYVNFNKDTYTYFKGISAQTGVYTQKGENLYSLFTDEVLIKDFEKQITGGFERNSIIFPNIFNFEFLFDFEFDGVYDFNRYIGFYVNKVQLEELSIDLDKLKQYLKDENSQYYSEPLDFVDISEKYNKQVRAKNENGIVLPIVKKQSDLDYINANMTPDKMFVSYLEDKKGKPHLLTNQNAFLLDTENDLVNLKLNTKQVDVSNFYGAGEVFAQSTGNLTFEKGRAFLQVDILNDFSDFDKIYVYHTTGSRINNDGERYDVFTARTATNAIVNDSGEIYFYKDAYNTNVSPTEYIGHLLYFNGEKANSDNAAAYAFSNLINMIPNTFIRAFTVDGTVILKCDNYGNHDNSFSIEFVSNLNVYNNIKINGKTGNDLIGTRFYFSGGSNSMDRLRISGDYKQLVLDNKEKLLVKTETGYDYIKSVVNYADNIDEDSFSTQTTARTAIGEYNDDAVIALLDDKSKPYVRNANICIYKRYTPKLGVFSFYNMADLDFDFYDTFQYNTPQLDLYKYFHVPADKDLLQPGITYKVLNGIIKYNDNEYNDNETFLVSGSPEILSYSIVSGSPIVILESSDYNYLPIEDIDGDIKDFSGFPGIKDILYNTNDIDTTSEYYAKYLKFYTGRVNNEYDYHRENYLKEYATVSKFNPFINKWGYLDMSMNSRSSKYRLNSTRVFGINNISPNMNQATPDSLQLTNEWYYIQAKHDFVKDNETIKNNYCYFDTVLNINELLQDESKFYDYFIYTPQNDDVYINRSQSRYSMIRYNENNGYCETLFRGVKLRFKEIANLSILGIDNKPSYKQNSKKYDGYKFSAILRPIQENINDRTTPPINYQFIEKEDYKFILLIIDIYLGSTNSLYGTESSIKYYYNTNFNPDITETSDLIINLIDSTYTNGVSIRSYNAMDGDYRLTFDNDGLSDLTYTYLYSVKNKKFTNIENVNITNYSNIKLPTAVLLNDMDTLNKTFLTSNSGYDYSNFKYNLKDFIHDYNDYNFIILRNSSNVDYVLTDNTNLPTDIKSSLVSTTNDVIKINGDGSNNCIFSTYTLSKLYDLDNILFPDQFFYNSTFKQIAGGKNYYQKLFANISVSKITSLVNSYSSSIEYKTFNTENINTDNTFYAEILLPSEITKNKILTPVVDTNIPNEFNQINIIGYNIESKSIGNYYLYRYSGSYEPILKFVNIFEPVFDSFGVSIKNANVLFNEQTGDLFKLNNFWHIKVADSNILKLQNNTAFLPEYDLINELTIGRADYNLLLSNWEYGFHYKYIDSKKYEPVYGIKRIGEDFTSTAKLLDIPNLITINQFDLNRIVKVNDLSVINIEDYDIVYQERQTDYIGYINIRNLLLGYFIENGVTDAFSEYITDISILDGLTLEQYVIEYLKKNIVILYDINTIDFYSKKTVGTNLSFVNVQPTIRNNQGYKLDRNYLINKFQSLVYKFSINKYNNTGFEICPEIKIRFI